MKKIKFLHFATIIFFLNFNTTFSQCTEAKDLEMEKYMHLTKTQDAEGCSHCGMLAMYFCSAKYCVKSEDVDKVGRLIKACKENIINMGQPYCCPDYLNKQPEWGSMAGGQTQTNLGENENPMLNNNSNPSSNPMLNALSGLANGSSNSKNFTQGEQILSLATDISSLLGSSETKTSSSQGTTQMLNALSSLTNGSSNSNTYLQGQQAAELATGLIDLFTPSPQEQARLELVRIENEKRAEEYRQAELKRRIENENSAKQEFNTYLKFNSISDENNQAFLVTNIMDIYISNKFNYDVSPSIPEWKIWMNKAIQNDNNYITTIFAGKALGYFQNKFNYNLDINPENAVKLLEKVANTETEYNPHLGISWEIVEKITNEKNKKKKVTTKKVKTFKITDVHQNSAASLYDLRVNDEIIKIDNEYIDDPRKKIQSLKIDSKIKVTFIRDKVQDIKEIILGKIETNLYNVDAMVLLANYYNTKEGGNNPEKTIYYFTRAAEKKSPNAMYALGQIYQYNFFGNKKVNVKFKAKKNEEFAYEWYLKSIANINYKKTSIGENYGIGTNFEPKSFDELILMYKKGIGCEKDLIKMQGIEQLKNDFLATKQ